MHMPRLQVHRLRDIYVRPNVGGKKSSGTLELHANGLRYQALRGEKLDLVFKNVQVAFFQPAEKEILVLIHFHLHDPIMIGKKKTKDVQFYVEVMEASYSLDNTKRSGYDPDGDPPPPPSSRRTPARLLGRRTSRGARPSAGALGTCSSGHMQLLAADHFWHHLAAGHLAADRATARESDDDGVPRVMMTLDDDDDGVPRRFQSSRRSSASARCATG